MKRARANRLWFLGLWAGITLVTSGCQTAGRQGDAGTSTGLPYRPPGTPTFTDLPADFRTFPAAQPLQK
jgi:hypothetical protein